MKMEQTECSETSGT